MTASPPDAAPEAFAARLARHLADLMRLAWPVMLSRAGILVMAFSDIAMLGRYGAAAIGEANLGISIFVPLIVITIGLSSGMVPVISQAFGAGAWAECGNAWRRALIWTAVTSTVAAAVCWQGEALLTAFGQTPELAASGGAVARALAPGMLGQALFAACAFYLEATRRPLPGLMAMIFANLVNVLLNWLLIWGHWGLPELGSVGAALASTVARFGAAGFLVLYILTRPRALAAGVIGPWGGFWGPGGWAAGRGMRRLGLAVATGVRVGIETGRGRAAEAAFAGWTGLLAVFLLMGALAALIHFNRDSIAWIYTDDPLVAARAAGLFAVSALVFVPDCAQVVMGQALRALGDAWVAVGCYLLSFLVLMVPLGWIVVHRFGYDERGLVGAILLSCVVATVLLAARFRWLTRGIGQ